MQEEEEGEEMQQQQSRDAGSLRHTQAESRAASSSAAGVSLTASLHQNTFLFCTLELEASSCLHLPTSLLLLTHSETALKRERESPVSLTTVSPRNSRDFLRHFFCRFLSSLLSVSFSHFSLNRSQLRVCLPRERAW